MELRHLRTFLAAAEAQSFTRAAETLGVSQAAVSQQIGALERELGVALFERTGRSVVPTDRGRRLYGYAQKILALIEDVHREVGRCAAEIAPPTLRLAVSTVPAETILTELLERFHRVCPDARETVFVLDSQAAIRAVEQNEADIGIVGELPRSGHLEARAIAADELTLVVSANHPLARVGPLEPEQLLNQRLILREPGSGSRRCVEQALADAGVSLNSLTNVVEMNSNEAIRSAVERGLGAAFLSHRTVVDLLADGRLVAVPLIGVRPRRHFYVITNARTVLKPAVRSLLQILGEPYKASNGP
ncbi:MAG: LysR family transcriptional regulator [Planctomycetes bacterium]|nr:LysR family transcriptional regulator [Planctomycetota bacterium]